MDELAGTTKSGLALALYALALGTFALGTTELVIVGLFPEVSGDRGGFVFAVSSFSGSAAVVVEVVGAWITCAAFVWLGFALLAGRTASAQRPARVS